MDQMAMPKIQDNRGDGECDRLSVADRHQIDAQQRDSAACDAEFPFSLFQLNTASSLFVTFIVLAPPFFVSIETRSSALFCSAWRDKESVSAHLFLSECIRHALFQKFNERKEIMKLESRVPFLP